MLQVLLQQVEVFMLNNKSDHNAIVERASQEADGEYYVALELERDRQAPWKQLSP